MRPSVEAQRVAVDDPLDGRARSPPDCGARSSPGAAPPRASAATPTAAAAAAPSAQAPGIHTSRVSSDAHVGGLEADRHGRHDRLRPRPTALRRSSAMPSARLLLEHGEVVRRVLRLRGGRVGAGGRGRSRPWRSAMRSTGRACCAVRRRASRAAAPAPVDELALLARRGLGLRLAPHARWAVRSALSSRSRLIPSLSVSFAVSASARASAASSQRRAKASCDSPGRDESLSSRVRLDLERALP